MNSFRAANLLVLLGMLGACSRPSTEPVVDVEESVPDWPAEKPDVTLDEDPQSPYQRLVAEHEQAMQDFRSAHERANTDTERQRAFDEKYPDNEAFANRFLQLAQQHRHTDAAKQALIWVIQYSHEIGRSNTAIKQLTQDHVEDPDLFAVCFSLSHANSTLPARSFLQAVLSQNPDESTRGMACFSLAKQLKSLGEMKQMLADKADRERLQQFFDPAEFALIEQLDSLATEEQVIALLERIKQEFAYVELPSGRKLGDLADAELFELQHLAIGKEAPEIEGQDADGETFKLSDYRGSVVLLDFWGDW